MRRCILHAATLASLSATSIEAQAIVAVEGVAYDSLARRPLVGAMIAVDGTGRTTISDAKGRFRIDSVPHGTRVFMMQHAAFDSLGLSGTAVRVSVQQKTPKVVLAVPSFETIWRATCGEVKAPKDSGLVFGTVRDAKTLDASAGVAVDGAWIDLIGGGPSLATVGQRRWRHTATTDARGEYALCGIPANTPLTLRAMHDSVRVTSVELAPTLKRVQRRDLLLSSAIIATTAKSAGAEETSAAMLATAPAGPSGTVIGIVTNASGMPIANAAVAVDTMAEVRTGEDGRFLVRHVPIGTRQVSIVAIGMSPHTTTFDLREGDTTRLAIPMSGVQLLSEVNVKANTLANVRELTINEHMKLGRGDFRDSTFLKTMPNMSSALGSIANMTVRGSPYSPTISSSECGGGDFSFYQDGHPITRDEFATIDVQRLAVLEVYKRKRNAPSDLAGGKIGCVIMLWTKSGLGK